MVATHASKCFVFKAGNMDCPQIRLFVQFESSMNRRRNGAPMRHNRKDQTRKSIPTTDNHGESSTILALIEQLDRDLKESEGKASKAQ